MLREDDRVELIAGQVVEVILANRSRRYPFDAPTRRRIEELHASDPLLGRLEAFEELLAVLANR